MQMLGGAGSAPVALDDGRVLLDKSKEREPASTMNARGRRWKLPLRDMRPGEWFRIRQTAMPVRVLRNKAGLVRRSTGRVFGMESKDGYLYCWRVR